jgi:antitoxin protein of toxin-antitoxin system
MLLLVDRLISLIGAVGAVRRYIRENPDKVSRVAYGVGRFVDKRTKGRYHRQINRAIRRVRSTTARI